MKLFTLAFKKRGQIKKVVQSEQENQNKILQLVA
jgi:hypothetical protein